MKLSPNRAVAALVMLALVLCQARARGQDVEQPELKLEAVKIGGVRATVTESWTTLQFTLSNSKATACDARVVIFYEGEPHVQYARDVWVPAGARLSSSVTIGPAPPQSTKTGRSIQMLLYDRTGGQNTLILPTTDEKVRSRVFPYLPRERTAVVLADIVSADLSQPPPLVGVETSADEAFQLTRILPLGGANDRVSIVPGGQLPSTLEAFDGIDSLILASNRLGTDPASVAALRQWVQQGGRLWIMLDLVDPVGIAALFDPDAAITVVDRAALTTVQFVHGLDGALLGPSRDFERPIDLVRLITSPSDRVMLSVNGWPVAFTRRAGRGQILFTTLGARAWYRPRTPAEATRARTNQPLGVPALDEIAGIIRPRGVREEPEAVDLRPILTEEIGYTVIQRNTSALLLGLFVFVLVAVGMIVRRSPRPEIVGWAGPAVAVLFMSVFVLLGTNSRRSVPPTIAIAAEVDAVSGNGEAAVTGLFASYQPTSGPALIASQEGAFLKLDAEGLEGQSRRRVQTDTYAWHWDDLSLPAGVRSGSFRSTLRTGRMVAVARFGAAGIEGRLEGNPFPNLDDVVLMSSTRELIAPRMEKDGRFTATPLDALASGQYLASNVLSDRQQRRQTVYRQLLGAKALPQHLEGRDLFLAWAGVEGVPFATEPGTRIVSSTLLRVPLEFERTPPGTPVVIPRAFVAMRRVVGGGLGQPTLEAGSAIEMKLRFQIPASVNPMAIERATFHARVKCPSRQFLVDGYAAGEPVAQLIVESPPEAIRLEITDRRLLELDAQGAIFVRVKIGEGTGTWTIESMGMDVAGKTLEMK